MSCCRRFALFCSLGLGLGLSACRDEKPPPEERTEPWPAPAASSARQPAAALVHYELVDKQQIDFELVSKDTKIVGYFPVVKGDLEVDLMHLDRTRGSLRVDLGAVRIEADNEREHISYSTTAANWLNVGSSIPESTREGRRWAKFEISEVFDTSSDAAHEGRLARRAKKSPKANTSADAGAFEGQLRKVTLKTRGPLSMNQRRMDQDANLSLLFEYPAEATPGFPPERVEVKSARALRISLDAFGIKPRNAAGILVATDMKLLGSTVSRIARVSFSLTYRQRPGKH